MWRLILILCITGCTPVSPQFYKEEALVRWHILTDRQLLKKCGTFAKGCYEIKSRVCHIFTKKPKYVNDNTTKTFGHEGLKCFLGRYHK